MDKIELKKDGYIKLTPRAIAAIESVLNAPGNRHKKANVVLGKNDKVLLYKVNDKLVYSEQETN